MKKKFTFLLAALVLFGGLVGPMGKAWGQTSGNYTLNFLTAQTDTPVTTALAMFGESGLKYMNVASGANAATNLYLSSEGLKFGKDGQASVLALVTNSSYGKVKPTAISFTFAKPIDDVSFAFWVNYAMQVGTIPSAGVGDERIVSVPITDGSALSRLQIATAATSPQMFVLKQIKVEYNADITASPSDIQLDTPVGTTTTGTFTINYSGLVEGSTINFVVPSNHTYEGYLTLQPSSFTPSNRTCGSTTVEATWAPQEPVQNASIQCSANCPASGIADVTMGVTANAQSISPSPNSLSFSYAFGNEAPEGQYVNVSCANLGQGNTVTVSLGEGQSSHFELWDTQSSQSEWNNLTQFTVTTTSTNPNWFEFGFPVRLRPGYEQGSTHSDVVNLTATVNGNLVSATITLTGEVTAPTYNIEFSIDVENYHGYAGCQPSNANVAGTLVTLVPYPDQGYVLGPWTIYEESTHRDVTNEVGLNGLTFTMPAYDILIEVSFVPQGEATPQITVPTEPLSFTYASGTLNPVAQDVFVTGINLGEDLGTDGYYISCLPDSHSTTFQLSNNGNGWTTDDHAWLTVFPTDPTEFSFYLGVRLKPGLEVGTYSDVLAVSLVHAGEPLQTYNINLTGTVTECVELQATNLQVTETSPHGFNFSFTPSPSYTGDEEWYWSITTEDVTPEYQWGIGYTNDPTWDNENHPNVYSNTQYYLWIGTRCGEDSYIWNTPSVPFTTQADCEVADEEFSCVTDAHNAFLTFNNGRDWQVRWSSYNTMPETEPETVTGSYYQITGLVGDTDYHVWVRTECEQDWYGHKQWSAWRQIDIHTEVACPAPDSVMAYGITGTTATVWWFNETPSQQNSWTVYLKARDYWGEWHSYTTNQNYFNFTSAQFDDEGGTNWEDWTWEVYVTRNCGGEDDESAPSETITFTTAQYQDYIVNDGLETNTQVPIDGQNANNYSMCQFIIPAEDLETMRYSTISSMTFYCQEAAVDWSSNAKFDVYLFDLPCGWEKSFSSEEFIPWDAYPRMKKVCTAKTLYVLNNVMEVEFDNTFNYIDGNLLVGIKQVATGTYADCHWIGDYTNYNASLACFKEKDEELYYYQLCQFLPKVKFAYEWTPSYSDRPANFEVATPNSKTVIFNWTPANSSQNRWELAIGRATYFEPENYHTWVNGSGEWLSTPTMTYSNSVYFEPGQEYAASVRVYNWDHSGGEWTCPIYFTIPELCEATDIQVTNITATDATISWEGAENANVRYREAQILSENFDRNSNSVEGLVSDGWTIISESDNTGNDPTLNPNVHMGDEGSCFRFRSFYTNSSSTSYRQYLITPEIAAAANLSFYYKGPSDEYEEYFKVGYSSTNANLGSFTWGDEITVCTLTWTEYTAIIPEGTKYVAIYYNPRNESRMDLFIDNFTIGNPNSTWNEQLARMPFDICCLTPETTYEFQLQPRCGGSNNGDWTAVAYFTTTPIKRFVGKENEEYSSWSDATNWSPEGVPTIYEDIVLEHSVYVNYPTVATAKEITQGQYLILLSPGAQLKHSNAGVYALVQKTFWPYTSGKDHYYLIANPSLGEDPQYIWLFMDDDIPYDFYRFDQTGGNDGKEWRNYKQSSFNFEPGVGYLYAQGYEYSTLVSFGSEQPLVPSENDYTILLSKAENADFSGWNLVGNPFACDAYIDRQFYRIVDGTGESELTLASGAIHPLEAVFVLANEDGERLTFSRMAPAQNELLVSGMPLLPSHAQSMHQDASLVMAISLVTGWNWWTPMAQITAVQLNNTLNGCLTQIMAKNEENVSGELNPGQMYKLYLTADVNDVAVTGVPVSPSITIGAGSNWIGYTGTTTSEIGEAISAMLSELGITPVDGDKIISQDGGFVIYSTDNGWQGTLTQLTQGHGYVYVRVQ